MSDDNLKAMAGQDELQDQLAREWEKERSSFAAPACSVAHIQQPTVVCPHCGYKYMESWDRDDIGKTTCVNCNMDFQFYREVTYTTKPLNSEVSEAGR